MSRNNVNTKTDRRVFRYTADGTRSVNVQPNVMRGGTRL